MGVEKKDVVNDGLVMVEKGEEMFPIPKIAWYEFCRSILVSRDCANNDEYLDRFVLFPKYLFEELNILDSTSNKEEKFPIPKAAWYGFMSSILASRDCANDNKGLDESFLYPKHLLEGLSILLPDYGIVLDECCSEDSEEIFLDEYCSEDSEEIFLDECCSEDSEEIILDECCSEDSEEIISNEEEMIEIPKAAWYKFESLIQSILEDMERIKDNFIGIKSAFNLDENQ